jgi:aldehyde:ferredoxin oxidoreductase
MGSKNLKAIAISGTKRIKLADPARFKATSDRLLKAFREDPERKEWIRLPKKSYDGPTGGVYPVKNWTEIATIRDDDERFGMKVYLDRIKKTRLGCHGCSYPCKDVVEIREGEYKGLTTNASTLVGGVLSFGIQCGVDNYERVVKCTDLANRYGIELWNFASVVQLAIELYERGIITDEDTEGLTLKADFETTVNLIEKTAFRQGIGAVLADGSLGIINKFGPECERYSVHIKGLDQEFDPRIFHFNMFAWCQLVNPQGAEPEAAHVATHLRWGGPQYWGEGLRDEVKEYCSRIDVPKTAVDRALDVPDGYNVGRLTKYAEDFYTVLTCLGICEYRTCFYDYDKLAELYSAATGIEMTPAEIKEAGDRVWNMHKVLNVREGFSRKDDRFPPKWLEPLKTASGEEFPLIDCTGEVVTAEKLERSLDDYYDERGWDLKSGIPSKEKLMDLRLPDVVADLQKRGVFK